MLCLHNTQALHMNTPYRHAPEPVLLRYLDFHVTHTHCACTDIPHTEAHLPHTASVSNHLALHGFSTCTFHVSVLYMHHVWRA